MLIGIDAGGTSTRAVVLDETGRCLGFGAGGGGNPVALGPAQAGNGIADAVRRAVRAARDAHQLDADSAFRGGSSVLALAGASSFAAPGAMASQVREISGVAHVQVASDLLAMFAAGTPSPCGYVLVSGTGAAALRVEDNVVAAAADGLGWLLGDAGSGFWIGHRAVRSALGAMSGHGPETVLARMLQQDLGLPTDGPRSTRGRFLAVEKAVETFYQMPPIELAKYASLVFRAAHVGDPTVDGTPVAAAYPEGADPVAVEILMEAAEQLVRTLGAVRVPELPGPVVMGGTVARRLPGLVEAVRASFGGFAAAPEVNIVPDGAAGAAVLSLRYAGITVDQEIFDRVTASLAELRRAR